MRSSLIALALAAVAGAAQAQVGGLFDADVEERTEITDPAEAVGQIDHGWLAFSIPAIEGTRSPCCWKGNWKHNTEIGCSLERDSQSYGTMSTSPVEDHVIAYVSIAGGKAQKLRVVGEQCPMDGSGQPVTWIGKTDNRDSLDWLDGLVREAASDGLRHSALWALALHADEGAGERLQALAHETRGDLAEESIFWLGEARGEAGYEVLQNLLDALPNGDTRRHINFALSQNTSEPAIRLLTDIARADRDPDQRADALFWLAQ